MPDGRARDSSRLTRLLLAAGVAAPLAAWTLSFAAMLSWPGYNPIASSISLLADAPSGWLQTAAFLGFGLLGLGWAVGMGRVLGSSAADRREVRALLLVQASLAIAFAAFPTDPVERGTSPVGRVHLLVFAAYAIALPLSLRALAAVMRRDVRWSGWARHTGRLGMVLAISTLLVPVTLYTPLVAWLGVLERLYVGLPTAWEAAISVAAMRRLGDSRST